jgi:hypothetical protein
MRPRTDLRPPARRCGVSPEDRRALRERRRALSAQIESLVNAFVNVLRGGLRSRMNKGSRVKEKLAALVRTRPSPTECQNEGQKKGGGGKANNEPTAGY